MKWQFVAQRVLVSRAEQMRRIARALDGAQRPESDLLTLTDKCHAGTCTWITESTGYRQWIDMDEDVNSGDVDGLSTLSPPKSPRFLWLQGPPGSGKSVASAQVVRHLTSYNLDCSYFFFHNAHCEVQVLARSLTTAGRQITSTAAILGN